MSHENRSWAFVKVEQSGSLNFSQVKQSGYTSTRKDAAISGSVATEFMVKWDGTEPATISDMRASGSLALYEIVSEVVLSGSGADTFDHHTTLDILSTPRWAGNTIL